jgi:hypothetical protein
VTSALAGARYWAGAARAGAIRAERELACSARDLGACSARDLEAGLRATFGA